MSPCKHAALAARRRSVLWMAARWGESGTQAASDTAAEGAAAAAVDPPAPTATSIEGFPGVSSKVVGRTEFFLKVLAPALFVAVALAASVMALITGQVEHVAVAGTSGVGGVATRFVGHKIFSSSG